MTLLFGKDSELHDYQKFKGSKTYQEPYDYYSIMHYRPEFNQYTFKARQSS